ncbi:MAG TPA: cyclomaltodextrinase N-terminal domain-containing protein, partial [Flavisolibacter sp.]|nr:cyclomaltodextrinase N-terminal domain-containing protein [Flavisolibacter sp.]
MKKIAGLVLSLFLCSVLSAQETLEIYPTHWWVGMKNPNLQVMIHQKDIGTKIPLMKLPAGGKKLAPGITLKGMHAAENPNYFFL